MGICVFVTVEGEDEPVLEQRTDGKPLADVVAGWIWFPEVVRLLGLSPSAIQSLQLVDQSEYGDDSGDAPADVWQDPLRLRDALDELRSVFQRVRANPAVIDEIDRASRGNASGYFDFERFDAYEMDVEDACAVCDWAAAHGKRVALVAS